MRLTEVNCRVKRHIPVRMCVFCRKRYPKADMRRFVMRSGRVVEDVSKTLPGRGAYCCQAKGCLERLQGGSKVLEKALIRSKRMAKEA